MVSPAYGCWLYLFTLSFEGEPAQMLVRFGTPGHVEFRIDPQSKAVQALDVIHESGIIAEVGGLTRANPSWPLYVSVWRRLSPS